MQMRLWMRGLKTVSLNLGEEVSSSEMYCMLPREKNILWESLITHDKTPLQTEVAYCINSKITDRCKSSEKKIAEGRGLCDSSEYLLTTLIEQATDSSLAQWLTIEVIGRVERV